MTIKGIQSLDAMIAKLEELKVDFMQEMLKAFEEEGREMVQHCRDTQSDPYGTKWEGSVTSPGKPILQHPEEHLSVERKVNKKGVWRVSLKLKDIYARHNFGGVKGGRKRQMLPRRTAPLPDRLRLRILARLREKFGIK